MRPLGSPETLEGRRIEAVALLDQGYAPVEVARKFGVDRRSVRRWNASRKKKGRDGLKALPAPGRPPRLDPRKKEKLRRTILQGAQASGFATELWTCPRIAQVIHREFKVRYHVDHVSRLLHSLGFSPQRPERRAVERNEKAIRRWVKVDWPDIKKKPKN